MSTIKDGGPAFPRPAGDTGPCVEPQYNHAQRGMTLRDYFAAKAMQGMLAGAFWAENADDKDPAAIRSVAQVAFIVADAMIQAREAQP